MKNIYTSLLNSFNKKCQYVYDVEHTIIYTKLLSQWISDGVGSIKTTQKGAHFHQVSPRGLRGKKKIKKN